MAELLWSEWDGVYVVYHRDSGSTHFLNSASFRLVTEILAEPRNFDSIAATLVGQQAVQDLSGFRQQVAILLLRLEQLGLVSRT